MVRVTGPAPLLLALLWASATPALRTQDVGRAYRELLRELEPDRQGDRERPDRARQIELLRAFVDRFAAGAARAPELLEARCRLGALHLRQIDPAAARTEFEAVWGGAERTELDLRGRALYGIAQAHELGGDLTEAKKRLRQLLVELEGTRYADFARVALSRLDDDQEPVEASRPAPEFGPRLDLTGTSRSLGAVRGRPALLLFWTAEDEDVLAAVQKTFEAARAAGLPAAQILSFAIDTDLDRLEQTAKRKGFTMPIIPLQSTPLDQLVLRYRLDALPTCFLVGPDGVLLARNLSPKRLRLALSKLLRGA